jgi:hypothetical protein
MKSYVKVALFVVFFMVLAGILGGLYLFNKKHTDTSRAKPNYIVNATALQKEFEDNEKDASAKYINKIIEVSGTIAAVNQTENSMLNIALKTGSDMSTVTCTLSATDDPAKYTAGNEITIRGECSGFLMDVQLNNCSVVANRK